MAILARLSNDGSLYLMSLEQDDGDYDDGDNDGLDGDQGDAGQGEMRIA